MVRAPIMIELTVGRDRSHANATRATVVLLLAAISCNRSRIVNVRSSILDFIKSPRPGFDSARLSRVYFPLRIPPLSGLQGVTPSPNSSASGSSSPSTVRSNREYSICKAMSGVCFRKLAVTCAWAIFQPGVLEKPM